jgi:hypothetical protein
MARGLTAFGPAQILKAQRSIGNSAVVQLLRDGLSGPGPGTSPTVNPSTLSVQRTLADAARFIADNGLELCADEEVIAEYCRDRKNPKELRHGLEAAWNARPPGDDSVTPQKASIFSGSTASRETAGHSDAISALKDNPGFLVKVTSLREAKIYEEPGGLGPNMPVLVGTIRYDETMVGGDNDTAHKLRAPTKNEVVIVLKNVAFGLPDPVILDAKIGFRTGYDRVHDAEEAEDNPGKQKTAEDNPGKQKTASLFGKGTRHKVMDSFNYPTSRKYGFRFESGQEWIKRFEGFCNGRPTASSLFEGYRPAIWRTVFINVIVSLAGIQKDMRGAPITFVGSSTLLVLSPAAPASCSAKMIDFAHPWREGQKGFDDVRANYVEGIGGLIDFLTRLANSLP